MASFSQITKGTRARKTVALPMGNGPAFRPEMEEGGAVRFSPAGDFIPVDLRPLSPGELADALSKARARAIALGVVDPSDGNHIYDLAEMEYTLAMACVDHDSPADAPRPFFDGGVEQIRSSAELGRDRLAFLFEQFQLFQDECSPTIAKVSAAEFMGSIAMLAGDEGASFFWSMGPTLRASCTLFLARQWLTSPSPRSPSSPTSEPAGTSGTPDP
jgi:hypothetical protein